MLSGHHHIHISTQHPPGDTSQSHHYFLLHCFIIASKTLNTGDFNIPLLPSSPGSPGYSCHHYKIIHFVCSARVGRVGGALDLTTSNEHVNNVRHDSSHLHVSQHTNTPAPAARGVAVSTVTRRSVPAPPPPWRWRDSKHLYYLLTQNQPVYVYFANLCLSNVF